jgi:ketosteroid isomerase-like protein
MSQENVERHRRVIEVYNAQDVEAFIALCDPSVEVYSVFAAVDGGVYHGHDGLREYFNDVGDAWEGQIRLEPEGYFDLGENTLAIYVLHGHGRQSGVEVTMPFAQVVRWSDGLGMYFKAYADAEDAFRDLGISVDALERIEP